MGIFISCDQSPTKRLRKHLLSSKSITKFYPFQTVLDNPTIEGMKNTPSTHTKDHGLSDVCLGVTFKRAARYYIYGIKKQAKYKGMKNYIRQNSINMTILNQRVNFFPIDVSQYFSAVCFKGWRVISCQRHQLSKKAQHSQMEQNLRRSFIGEDWGSKHDNDTE